MVSDFIAGDQSVNLKFWNGICLCIVVTYFPAHKTHWPIRHTVIFSLEILEKNNDECILILVIYW
jgi:hypothetical protein